MSFFKILWRVTPIQLKATPWHNFICVLLGILRGVTLTFVVISTQRLFDAIASASVGEAGFWDCFIPLLTLAGASFLFNLYLNLYELNAIAAFEKSTGKIRAIVHRKLTRIDPVKYEETQFLDDMNKAQQGIWAVTYFVLVTFIFVAFYGTYFLTIGAYLFSLKPLLLLTLLLAFIPAMLSQIVRARVFTKLEEESAPIRRENEYYQKTLCDREYFKETRILGAYSFFYNLFFETLTLLTSKLWKAGRKTELLQLLLNTVSFIGMGIASYMLFVATMTGEITIGAFAAVFASLSQLFAIMQYVISNHVNGINENIGRVVNLIRLLDMPERTGRSGISDFTKGIIARDISFTYPGRSNPAVENVSLSIACGETIAIVGQNGSGKSTLVRLLTGIYRPDKGKVTVGGLDTAETLPLSVYQSISGVFQKYQQYKMTLNENVAISELDKGDDNVDFIRVETALKQSDLSQDIDPETMLSPEFGGIDLSGGQWQRLAIARGLYRQNEFIVLDEPTSAIDPIEEQLIFSQFQQLVEGKSAIIVTHRLGSAKLANRIIVLEDGKIVEQGTHDELLMHNGKYAQMWATQAQWYIRTSN